MYSVFPTEFYIRRAEYTLQPFSMVADCRKLFQLLFEIQGFPKGRVDLCRIGRRNRRIFEVLKWQARWDGLVKP